jgi:enoyl-CoA hydratase/carnithine racemase
MNDNVPNADRRVLIIGAAASALAAAARMDAQAQPPPQAAAATTLADVPLNASNTVTVERRGDIVLIGLNRQQIQNRIDPPMRAKLAEAVYGYEHDPTLRAAILFGHGPNFSRGIDVDAQQTQLAGGPRPPAAPGQLDPLGNNPNHRTKPVIAVVHGETWNLGHELYLACDIRIAAANTDFGQDEASHARFPGGGGTVRFVREAGWGNAMRYMLTGDHFSAEESMRIGVTQMVAPTQQAALDLGVAIARKIAACGPLGIKATLATAHMVIDPVEMDTYSKLGAQYTALYRTEDFLEGRKAEAEGRPANYQGR